MRHAPVGLLTCLIIWLGSVLVAAAWRLRYLRHRIAASAVIAALVAFSVTMVHS